jgi:amidase
MSKSTEDLSKILSIFSKEDLTRSLTKSWDGVRVGFVDPDLWQAADFVVEPNASYKKETYAAFEDALSRVTKQGGIVTRSVPLISLKDITSDPEGVSEIEEFFGNFIPMHCHGGSALTSVSRV